MKIMDFLDQEMIITDLKSSEKKSVIVELMEILKDKKKIKEVNEIVNVVLEREKLGSTGIGQGIAIPHGKINILKEQIGILGISKNGIEFNSLDGELVHIIFLLVGPDIIEKHLKALYKISSLFKDKFLRQAIKNAATSEEIVKIIQQEDNY
ncbi:MAG: PTS sugar transporter subunit IIA [Endomicrobium sp.]|jgi:PTS system nitrogen regulatory IIA component|nr:PTS sugar transporter subunit IIA [Endomicrobium sp.]